MIPKLLSLPPNPVDKFHDITGLDREEYFCTCDPDGARLGSGGGTTWLLEECHREWCRRHGECSFEDWISKERRILLHAGGQSRRLPAYAPSGKILTPVPVFRWERGQRLSQTLLDLQLPLYERIMAKAPGNIHTMIVSGDVYIRADRELPAVPEADVVCYGLWLDASIATGHGVFFSRHSTPGVLERMLQKPSVEKLKELLNTGYYLTDIGVWLLSDRAVELLRRRSRGADGELQEYDLYSEFGCALGTDPSITDEELKELTVAVVPLPGGEFYHFGTSREMISSTLAIQNRVADQRMIMHRDRKPHPTVFVQNSLLDVRLTPENTELWIENSHVPESWRLASAHVITGVPRNDWEIKLEKGMCVDIVPVATESYMVRVYHIDDRFAGDEQRRPQFPVVETMEDMERAVKALLAGDPLDEKWPLMSAEQVMDEASLERLVAQRREFRRGNWGALAENHDHSVFYQLDLDDAANAFAENDIPLPEPLSAEGAPLMTRISDAMFRAEVERRRKAPTDSAHAEEAFALLREGLTTSLAGAKELPRRAVCSDQIVWSRSPVRIDIAGGWTDTPPFCLMEGGNVVNMAIELNGQQPLQAYIRPCGEPHIVCRSIDLGAAERIETFDQLYDFRKVGSPFSIPKAALTLAGFHPLFCKEQFPSLRAQLEAMGGGLEITLFSAVPAGSGLGTSSILASTVLGAVSDFCALGWDKVEICRRTLVLEQLLTTGGGWQDQYGGVTGGVKLLQTSAGFDQTPAIRYLPTEIFTGAEYAPCHLLYYTGLTRTAKEILAEIVRRMFLNHRDQLELLRNMKAHTMEMYDAIQRSDFKRMGQLVGTSWNQNMSLDPGTNPAGVEAITRLVDDLCLGYKLPGAGGGGFLYMVAKDPEAAVRIRQILTSDPTIPANARFVDMAISPTGLQVTRS